MEDQQTKDISMLGSVKKAGDNCQVLHGMIETSAVRLDGLRNITSSATLTHQEIRNLECKLVRMFSELILEKTKSHEKSGTDDLRQWLRVVGLCPESLGCCTERLRNLEELLEKSANENYLRDLIQCKHNTRDEEIRRLLNAMQNLQKCYEALKMNYPPPENLFWHSWKHNNHHHHHRNSVGNIGNPLSGSNNGSTVSTPNHIASSPRLARLNKQSAEERWNHNLAPPKTPSPPVSPSAINGSHSTKKRQGTPPAKRKMNCNTPTHSPGSTYENDFPKSKSHENHNTNNTIDNQFSGRSRHHTDTSPQCSVPPPLQCPPSPSSPSFHNSFLSENGEFFIDSNPNVLQVPRSPCTPLVNPPVMGHTINHRFTTAIKLMATCDLCQKQVFLGLKCTECKYRCHKDCRPHVPPSCGLPKEFVDEFIKTLSHPTPPSSTGNTSPSTSSWRGRKLNHNNPDSSSPGSSCNSSSPSSPAPFSSQYSGGSSTSGGGTMSKTPLSATKTVSQFNFPEVTVTNQHGNSTACTKTLHSSSSSGIDNNSSVEDICSTPTQNESSTLNTLINSNCSNISAGTIQSITSINSSMTGYSELSRRRMKTPVIVQMHSDLADSHKSNDSDKTASQSGSTSASTDSDRTPIRLDSTEEDSGNWHRQNSTSMKEWDIPYTDLSFQEEIGKGRFGTVHRAHWHGDVAVKILYENYLNDESNLESFRLEVANFRKTRHENLVLFMGACMNPPNLAIVTSLCKGKTLYTLIHMHNEKFPINKITIIAQQICQGMGYLHARGISHKNLRTKNIFLENGKVIITDFGLFSSIKLQYCDLGLGIPYGWLCYLSPELIRSLTPYKPTEEILPFTKASDIYSFGTVWYELLCSEFPFKYHSPQAIIWQVGRGMKQSLSNLQTSRDVKEILMACWAFRETDRLEFSKIKELLEKLPKKRLARSPSHPIQLSKSAECLF